MGQGAADTGSMPPAGPLERKWMLFELFFVMLPVTFSALIGCIMALCILPWILMLAGMEITMLVLEGQLPGQELAIAVLSVFCAMAGLVGTFSLWTVFVSRFRGSDEFTDIGLIAHGIWIGILALLGARWLTNKPITPAFSWELAFLLLVTVRLWWLAQSAPRVAP